MIKEIIPLVNGCKKMKNYKLRDDSRDLLRKILLKNKPAE